MHPYTGDYTEQRKNEEFNIKFSDMNISICLFYRFVLSFSVKPSRQGFPFVGASLPEWLL